MTLKIICNCLSKRPRILDVIMLFSQPSDFMPSLTKLINTWKWEDKGEKQQVYEEFSNIILFIMAFQCRFDLSLDDLGLDTAGSFLQTLITRGHLSSSLDDLDTKTKDKVGAWIRALFVSEGISDDSIPCCPQDYYSIIATVISQSMAACERNRLAFETLKGGFDYLLEPFLLPSLLFALRWLEGHVLDYQGDITPSLRILEALIKPTAILGDAQETHQLILQIISKSFEDTLKIVWVKHPNQADTVGRILEVFKAHGSYQRSEAVHHSQLRTWLSNSAPGGIVSDLLSTFSSLVYWSTNPEISLTPFPYTHCQLLTALRTVGAVAVLQGLLKELQDQANNGSLDIALDVAASYVVAPTVETFARDRAIHQHQQALNENGEAKDIPPRRAGSTLMSLRDALVCEHESLSSERIKQDEFRAQLVVRLFRRVNALTMPPQPISQDIQVPDLDVTNILPGVPIDDSHAAGDTGMQGVQAIFEPVPGGGGAMPASGNDIGGLNTFDMLIDDSDFMLDNFFHS
ncbi:Trihydroxynaphthalene reductase [Ascosphaera pollenicola]|nr:Trihydroxynaphthalene reductase [Ascosphaera pollenicola]